MFPIDFWQGRWHSLAILKDGSVHSWGRRSEGQLGSQAAAAPGGWKAKEASAEIPPIAKRSIAWNRGAAKRSMIFPTPVDVSLFHGKAATSVAAGGCLSLAIDLGGTVWYWGTGRGLEQRETPCRVPGLPTNKGMFTAIAAGQVMLARLTHGRPPVGGRVACVESCCRIG